MRTTLTLDEDVADLLKKEVRRSGEPLKQTVNRLLRNGLQETTAPIPLSPFKVEPFSLGLPPEWTSGSTEELLELLDGPLHR